MASNSNEPIHVSLERIDRAEQHYKFAFLGAAAAEAVFLFGYLALADLSNRTHLLVLIATVGIYSIVALGLVALGAHVNRNTLRILKAIQLTDERGDRSRLT